MKKKYRPWTMDNGLSPPPSSSPSRGEEKGGGEVGGQWSMVNGLLTLLAMTFLLGCTGTIPRTIEIELSEPADLSSLPTDTRDVTIAIFNSLDESQVHELTLNSENNKYTAEIPSLENGTYSAELCLWYPYTSPSQTTNSFKLEEGSSEVVSVPVAIADLTLQILPGQGLIEVRVVPGDFTIAIDDDGDGLPNLSEVVGLSDPFVADTDNDGVVDGDDAFPSLSSEFGDADGDGIGDISDNCPGVANADRKDTDDDGMGDACDIDDDNDGVADADEGILGTNPLAADTDADGFKDGLDNCPAVANLNQLDSDSDESGDACDTDDDNDGILDVNDNCPFFVSQNQIDSNGDGVGDECTDDNDGDGVLDAADNCPTVSNTNQTDTDTDTTGDACDLDDDNDDLTDTEETTPGADNLITSTTSADTDGDLIPDAADNCPITNEDDSQTDTDGDGEGDACDCDSSPGNTIVSTSAIFVSTLTGNDSNSGARNNPVKTIQRAITLAGSSGKAAIYLSVGTYEEAVAMSNGVSIYGGFLLNSDASGCLKSLYEGEGDAETNTTEITSSSSPVVSFLNLTSETLLEGVTVKNTATSGPAHRVIDISSSTQSIPNTVIVQNSYITAPSIPGADVIAVNISNASPVFINNIINAGESQDIVAVHLVNSPAAKFYHNTIRGGNSSSASTALRSTNSSPTLANNIIFTAGGEGQKVLYFRDETLPVDIVLKNNLIFAIDEGDDPMLCQKWNSYYFTINDVNDLGGNFGGNIRLTDDGTDDGDTLVLGDLFVDPDNGDFRLIDDDAIVIDAGIIIDGISTDRDGIARDINPDIGAFEWR